MSLSFLELLALLVAIYSIIFIIFSAVVESNFSLWYHEHFGKSIHTLHAQVVWITGASSGIGRALAFELARYGVRLALSARQKDLLDAVKVECLKKSKGLLTDNEVIVLPMDVLEISKHEEYFNRIIKHFGCVDILINNAGRPQRANWVDIDTQVDRDMFESDVFSAISLSRIVVRYFLEKTKKRGHIACTSSITSFAPVPFSSSYTSAKQALNAYMYALHVEHPSINTTIFAPGPVDSDFLQEAFTEKPRVELCEPSRKTNRLSADRCAHLFAVALANNLRVTWCCVYPNNLLLSLSQVSVLAPIVHKFMGSSMMKRAQYGRS